MDTETTKQVVFLAAIVIGQILMVYIPYMNKQREDGREFNLNYAYTAILGYICMSVMALQSESVMAMPLNFMSVMLLAFGSATLQREVVAVITPRRIRQIG